MDPPAIYACGCNTNVVSLHSQPVSVYVEILNSHSLPEPIKTDDAVAWYPWTINNKYYTAEVSLCTVPNTFHMSLEIFQSTQAFVAYFDSSVVSKDAIQCFSFLTLVLSSCIIGIVGSFISVYENWTNTNLNRE